MCGVFFILIPFLSILYFYKKLKLIGLQLESNANFFLKKNKNLNSPSTIRCERMNSKALYNGKNIFFLLYKMFGIVVVI